METLPADVSAYLAAHHVMTLATQGADGPWAAAVFYAWDDGALLFLSSPSTRHCRNLDADPRCAATIQDDTDDWKAVRGMQIEGRVERLHGDAAAQARARYAAKYPLVSPLVPVPPAIAEALARIAWYRLVPARLCYIDNARGFGHRDEFSAG